MTIAQNEMQVAKINEAINAGMEATCQSHPRNHGIPLERVETGWTAMTKRSYPRYVMIYQTDMDRLYNLALTFLGQHTLDDTEVKLFDVTVNGEKMICRGTEQTATDFAQNKFAGENWKIAPRKFLALSSQVIELA